jgi:hypothetical protein
LRKLEPDATALLRLIERRRKEVERAQAFFALQHTLILREKCRPPNGLGRPRVAGANESAPDALIGLVDTRNSFAKSIRFPGSVKIVSQAYWPAGRPGLKTGESRSGPAAAAAAPGAGAGRIPTRMPRPHLRDVGRRELPPIEGPIVRAAARRDREPAFADAPNSKQERQRFHQNRSIRQIAPWRARGRSFAGAKATRGREAVQCSGQEGCGGALVCLPRLARIRRKRAGMTNSPLQRSQQRPPLIGRAQCP